MKRNEMKKSIIDQSQWFQIWNDSPVGRCKITTNLRGISAVKLIRFSEVENSLSDQSESLPEKCRDYLTRAVAQLEEYFQGKRKEFNLPLDLSRLSPFSQKVLEETRKVRFGQVCSYSEIGKKIGQPNAGRAVGMALAHNPFLLVVPCHRVVGRDHHLHGYSAPNGILTKAWLLEFEGHLIENMKVIR